MKVLQLLLISVLAFAGCKKPGNNLRKPDTLKTMVPDTSTYHYLALGDSYTIGTAVALEQSYPYQLVGVMNNDGLPTPAPAIIATDGWITDNLIAAISQRGITGNKYQVVTLLIGVNDQYEGLSETHYQTNFVQLLHTAINLAEGGDSTRVFVLSIPDYGVTPFGMGRDSIIGPQIDQFNAINKQESLKAGVNYVDVTGISKEAATDPTLIASDGLHPSPKMYKLWIDQLAPMVVARLKK